VSVVALTSVTGAPSIHRVLLETIIQLTPGASDPLIRSTLTAFVGDAARDVGVLVLGAGSAGIALTTAMGQLERGANRLYGIGSDRPTRVKYGRAMVMACVAGLPAMGGFLVLVTAEALAESIENVYGLDDDATSWLTWTSGVALLWAAVTVMHRYGPRRRQPGWSFLSCGSFVALFLWTFLTALLAGALQMSAGLGNVYGPLTGVMALLVWVQLTSAAVFLGLAVSAELELGAVGSSGRGADVMQPQRAAAAPQPGRRVRAGR
jgi:uncharacterized BrkB/YihY/UPF0761 family membrane protein